jgi:hypothetical protein
MANSKILIKTKNSIILKGFLRPFFNIGTSIDFSKPLTNKEHKMNASTNFTGFFGTTEPKRKIENKLGDLLKDISRNAERIKGFSESIDFENESCLRHVSKEIFLQNPGYIGEILTRDLKEKTKCRSRTQSEADQFDKLKVLDYCLDEENEISVFISNLYYNRERFAKKLVRDQKRLVINTRPPQQPVIEVTKTTGNFMTRFFNKTVQAA